MYTELIKFNENDVKIMRRIRREMKSEYKRSAALRKQERIEKYKKYIKVSRIVEREYDLLEYYKKPKPLFISLQYPNGYYPPIKFY